ncbi:probable tRNA methyltransferase 9B [Nephila pilipes]|uniref:Probable tRNA methyltransferase 9B n=1 Tax=Nephila pilipes TaxID=299642 RepID=A0A8X6NXK6_NEPPI|nr:probable tRNA methyltransferase 9B [Nephila pilipes]
MTQSVMAGDNHEERQARSLALEKAYVHDVYDQIAPHFTDTRYRPWPRVKQFLLELEPGSLVADVGCGNGKYLDINADLMKIGTDRCAALTAAARAKNFEVLTSDNLHMPFRDETFDAVLSIAVIHHFATTDRRVAAIKELTRVLRIGGKVLITVWAMEQRHRKFDSQDVLVPWHEPVKSSSEDRGSSVERELTSTTTSDDDVLVYHAYSHISDSESHQHSAAVNRKRQKYRNGRGRYRSADSAIHCRRANATSSQSSSELSSPNETCYSFVRRAFQKLSNSTTTASQYDNFAKKSPPRPYFYRSCRKPCVSESMEFGKYNKDSAPGSPKKEFCHQDSLDSEYPDPTTEDDVPIELRHLEGYETCKKCGTPTDFGYTNCEQKVCASCLPADPDAGKKSRSLGDFLNMIPKLLRVKKCEKEPMSDLHKRISTASDPREYVVKTRGNEVNGIVRSKSTVSMMSRLEELMSMSPTSGKDEPQTVANPNCSAGPRSKAKPSLLQSFTSTVLVESSDGTIEIRDSSEIKNLRRYNSPADALQKLRQDVALDEPFEVLKKNDGEKEINSCVEKKLQNNDCVVKKKKSALKSSNSTSKETNNSEKRFDVNAIRPVPQRNNTEVKPEEDSEGHLSSYYSMPELYKLTIDQIPEEPIVTSPKQRHISFFEQAQNIFADTSSESNDLSSRRRDSPLHYAARERTSVSTPQRGLVKRSLSVDTGDNSSSSHQAPRRFSASAAQGVMASGLRNCSIPRSCSRGSSVKSDTSVDSEESIVSVIPRKGNSITSDTSVDSEESVISVIQRSTSEIDTLGSQNGLRNNISRFGSRSAQASPVTVLSSQTSSAESSPPQSGKNDGRFPGSVGVIDQLMQQQQMLYSPSDVLHSRPEGPDHSIRTRRCLLRPISDPKIEEKLTSQDEFSNSHGNKLNNCVQIPKPNQDISAAVEVNKTLIKEKPIVAKPNVTQTPPVKPLIVDSGPNWKPEKKEQADGELSKTPSPVGPFQYITDPLITGIESATVEIDQPVVSANETESKSKSIRFNTEVTNLEQKIAALPEIRKPPNGLIESVLRNAIPKKGIVDVNPGDTDQIVAVASTSVDLQNYIPTLPDDSKELQSNLEECSDFNSSEDLKLNKNKDNDMRKSFFKLRERLESLASSQNSMPNFEIFKNVSHSFGSLRNIKEKIDSETPNDSPRESKISPTPKSLNDSRQSSLDESSQVTLSDESVMSVEGTSSVSDENDYKKTDDDEENLDSSQNLTVKKADEDRVATNASAAPLNVLTDARQSSQKHCQTRKCESCAHKPSKAASFSDTEVHLKKTGVRCPLRKRLRRSCVTIDEVECPEFVSSEDTSPSSSVSLEWNDFDKLDAETSACTACCSGCGIPTIAEGDMNRDEPSIAICCEDVNVAETETKFNIVDKEMCVFFETPSSSIGKSASSSSNATDFSTTSDRFRGVMQREKSDDRSSKESDSDNLSKLSDVEGRPDSAFSEDFAKKTDLASSSSSVSLDVLESMRAKLNNDAECEGVSASSKQTSNWVLDNIDEIPDDDQSHDDGDPQAAGADKSPSSSISWKPEKSMDFAQRRENFLSCAADCRDMYRITFDDKSKGMKENISRSCSVSSSEIQEPVMMAIPDIAPGLMELFPPRKNQDDDERSTGILAELVGTLSGISSLAFGDIYPKQEAKFEEFSSDESVGISTFEKVLTSGTTTHSKSRPRKSSSHQKEKGLEEPSEKRSNNKKSMSNGHDSTNNHSDRLKNEMQNLGQAFVKLPPENGPRIYSEPNKDKMECQDLERNIQNSENTKEETTNGSNTTQPIQNGKKIPDKLKILNRTSQSVCLDRIRQSSFEKDDESLQSTQSAPCSPRMKPRQRSVEEVLSSSRNELSRNSSLSQSTSQESLPGNETGGLMSYHRYYHVFRQGELDNLIETHVDNLHIISSYYDHANWCVVAEKVQVWTI